MTKRVFITLLLCAGVLSCTGSPKVDTRPQLIITAEKSLKLGVDNYNENNFDKAEAHFSRALFLYRNIDDPAGIISSCINIAKTRLATGNTHSAQSYAEFAKSVAKTEQLTNFDHRLTLIESSIAIEKNEINNAKRTLEPLLNNKAIDSFIKIAAIQNRTRIAFLDNDNPGKWIAQYEDAIKQPSLNTSANRARLLRFKAALNPDAAAINLEKALQLYRKNASSPGIAATLTEWGIVENSKNNYASAINKLERALFIRTSLKDSKNSHRILALLSISYRNSGNDSMSRRTEHWQSKLEKSAFGEWEAIRIEFGHFPAP